MSGMQISRCFHEWVKAWHTRRDVPSARSTASSKAGYALAISAMMVFSAAAGAGEGYKWTGETPINAKSLQPTMTMEPDTDRPGQNLRVFDLKAPDPALCAQACGDDNKCRAYTYVKPGVQGPKARCWLKTGIPAAKPNPCCVSGVRTGQGEGAPPTKIPVFKGRPLATGTMTVEKDTDRPGANLRSFDLNRPDPQICAGACEKDTQCRAYTYVRPGVQGPKARCWLKSGAPKPVPNRCCVSGVKATKTAPAVDQKTRPEDSSNRTPQESPAQPKITSQSIPGTSQGQHTTAQIMSQVTRVPVSKKLEMMVHQKHQELKLNLKSELSYRGQTQKETLPKRVSSPTLRTCESAQITSVILPNSTTPTTIRPGEPLNIKGCGFSSITYLLMYDPKGPNDAFSKPWYLPIEKLTDTEIKTHIPIVNPNGGIGFFKKPIPISVRTLNKPKNEYSNPGNLVLEPNMEIYIVQGLTPAKLGSFGALIQSYGGINTVFHASSINTKTYTEMGGTDILFWGKKLEEGFTFENAQVIWDVFCYTTDHNWESVHGNYKCANWEGQTGSNYFSSNIFVNKGELDQPIDNFKGTPSIPRLSIQWELSSQGKGGVYGAILYKWAIFVRGPEGLASFGF
jgi:hypothetical protein